MKRLVLIIAIFASFFLVGNVYAKTEALDLKDTLKAENIELKSKYSENDDQVTIYLFRGQGCSHCQEFLEYLSGLTEKQGKMFKLRSYEVWENDDNKKLKEKVVDTLKVDASGVPFIVIGKDSFYGFDDSTPKKFEKVLKAEYEKEKSERYDVIKEATKLQKKEETGKKSNSAIILLIPVALIAIIIFLSREPKENNA